VVCFGGRHVDGNVLEVDCFCSTVTVVDGVLLQSVVRNIPNTRKGSRDL